MKLDKDHEDKEKLNKKSRRFVHVPETPEEKLKNQRRSRSRLSEDGVTVDDSWEDERQFNVIPQTPIGKIRKGNFF